jgi:hypothetical protein
MTTKKLLKIIITVLLVLSISGCTSFITSQGPLMSRLEDGKKTQGGFSKYKYSGSLKGYRGHLEKTPMCAEIIEKIRVAQKQKRGRVFTWVEMVFFGLGLLDFANTEAVIEESKKEVPLAKFESSHLVACGEKMPAANEEIVIFVRPEIINDVIPKSYYRTAWTDENGVIDFNKVFADENRTLNLTARLATDESEAVSFMYIPPSGR